MCQLVVLMWYSRQSRDNRVYASCPDMNISVGCLNLLVLIKADVDASATEWHSGVGQWHEGLSFFFFFQAHFLLKHAGNLLGQIVFNETIIGLFGC